MYTERVCVRSFSLFLSIFERSSVNLFRRLFASRLNCLESTRKSSRTREQMVHFRNDISISNEPTTVRPVSISCSYRLENGSKTAVHANRMQTEGTRVSRRSSYQRIIVICTRSSLLLRHNRCSYRYLTLYGTILKASRSVDTLSRITGSFERLSEGRR